MKSAGNIYGLTMALAILLICSPLRAEKKDANIWASVQFNKRSVVVGEPLMVTITVYTSTWFTSPPEFSEIQVPDAIMVEYQQRTGSMRKTIGNKSYPAIEKKYLVYPLKEGENSLPSLSIVTECPPEGDYKGKRKVIESPARTFRVDPVADGVEMEQWLTASNVKLSEQWDRPLEDLKQGDVLERQITIKAYGALAALIPPLQLEDTDFGNIYSRAPSLNNIQNQSSITGTRTEIWNYLMESEGTYTIPGISIFWYDPGSNGKGSAQIGSREITIAANPNMDFLLSMQDSLQAMLETGGETVDEPFQWMGLNWWQLMVLVFTLLIVLYLGYRLIRRITDAIKEYKIISRDSEERYFVVFLKVSKEGDPALVMGALLNWYDRYRLDRYGPTFGDFICATGDSELLEHFSMLEGILYAGSDQGGWSGHRLAELVSKQRKLLPGRIIPAPQEEFAQLNPVSVEPLNCEKREL